MLPSATGPTDAAPATPRPWTKPKLRSASAKFDLRDSSSLARRLKEVGWEVVQPLSAPHAVKLADGMSVGAYQSLRARRAGKRATVVLEHGHFDQEYDKLAGAAKGRLGDMVTLVVLVDGDRDATLELYRDLVDGDPYFFPTKPIPKQWGTP